MDILNTVAVEMPCKECGGNFKVSLGQILLAQEGMRATCNALGERECPGFYYAGLIDHGLCDQLVSVWHQIESHVEAEGAHLVVVADPRA